MRYGVEKSNRSMRDLPGQRLGSLIAGVFGLIYVEVNAGALTTPAAQSRARILHDLYWYCVVIAYCWIRNWRLCMGVTTKVLLQAVRRNSERFAEDFMIQLSAEEWGALRSQFVTLKPGRGQHRKYLPYAFTEQGIAWISPTLKRIQVPARCRAK